MALFSHDSDASRYFGFSDLHGFKDYVVYVMAYAPNNFPHEDWREHNAQMTLERAFSGLRYGLSLPTHSPHWLSTVSKCRELVDRAYNEYLSGNTRAGQTLLEQVERLLNTVPTR